MMSSSINQNKTSTVINFGKYPLLKVIKYLPLREQLMFLNFNKRLRNSVLSYSKLIKVYINCINDINKKVAGYEKSKSSQRKNSNQILSPTNVFLILFQNDFIIFSCYLQNNFLNFKFSDESILHLESSIFTKIIKNYNFIEKINLNEKFPISNSTLQQVFNIIKFDDFKIKNRSLGVIVQMLKNLKFIIGEKCEVDGLSFSNNKLSDCNNLSNILNNSLNFKYLDLSGSILTFDDLKNLFINFINFENSVKIFPEVINFSNCQFLNEHIQFLSDYFSRSKFKIRMEDLTSDSNNLKSILEGIFSLPSHIPINSPTIDLTLSLKSINLSNNKINSFLDISNFIDFNPNLENLNLSNNLLSDIGLENIISKLIKKFTFNTIILDNNKLTDIGGEQFYNLFRENKSFKIISLVGNLMNSSYHTIFSLRYNKSIEIIDLSDGNINDEKMTIIFNEINENKIGDTLQSLYLDNNSFTDKWIDNLFEFLFYPKFRKISLLENYYFSDSIQCYYETILRLKWDDYIYLDKINFEITENNIEYLVKAIKSNSNLISFSFKYKSISSHLTKNILEALKYCPKLSYLSLKESKINDSLLINVCELIRCCKYLCKIDLSDNLITDDGVGLFLQQLKTSSNKYLSKINFHNNKINDHIQQIFEQCDQFTNNFNNDYYKRIIKVLDDHKVPVFSLLLLSDGKFASGSDSEEQFKTEIKIWDPECNYECVQTLKGHTFSINALILLPGGKILSGSDDRTIKVWDPKLNYACVRTISGHAYSVTSLFYIPNNKFASGSEGGKIKVWDINKNYECIMTSTEHADRVSSFLLLEDDLMASCSDDSTIKIWDMKTNFTCIKTLTGHKSGVTSIVLLSNGKIASGSSDCSIKIWSPEDNFRCIMTIDEHQESVFSLILLPDGRMVSASEDRTLKIWDNKNYQCIKTLTGHKSSINSIILLADSKIASAANDGKIKIWG